MNKEHNTTTVRSLERVMEWELNPRRGTFRGIAELCESIRTVGLQDAIHVWERTDGDYLLKGHRRVRAMREMGMTECEQVVHRFESAEEAFLFLLQDHGHTDGLDNEEKIVAVENGVGLGLTAAEIAPALGVKEERVQLWFDLGNELPLAARSALGRGALSMNVAEMLLAVAKEDRVSATQLVLHDPTTNEPMAPAAARAAIESRYVLPKKWEAEWVALAAKLKKKGAKVIDGFEYVEFADRLDYLQGNSGQPWAEYEYGDGFIPGDAKGRRWMEQAQELGVPVMVVAAPSHVDGHVLLVSRKMLRDAAVAGKRTEEDRGPEEEVKVPGRELSKRDEEEKAAGESDQPDVKARRLGVWLKTWLGAIYEALLANPTDVMTKEPWLPVRGFLAHLVTDVDAGAFEAWTGIAERSAALAWMEADGKNRAHLRTALMLLLCAESDASDEPERIIREVATALGVDGEVLEARVEMALGE